MEFGGVTEDRPSEDLHSGTVGPTRSTVGRPQLLHHSQFNPFDPNRVRSNEGSNGDAEW